MKFTRTLLAVSLFTAAQLVTAQADKPDAFVQQLLEKQYPHNEKALKVFNEKTEGEKAKRCYFKGDKELSNEGDGMYGHCMKFVGEKIADTAQGKRRYILFSGDNLAYCHGCPGLDSLFIFTSTDGKDWSLLSHKETNASGPWGQGSSEVEWQEIGPGSWGIMNEGVDAHNSTAYGVTKILRDDGEVIREAAITFYFSNGGAVGCGEEFDDIDKKKLPDCAELDGTVEIRKDLPAMGNTYPLQVTINGYEGLKLVGKGKNARTQPIKEYKNEKFLFSYNPDKHEYIMPTDYPKSLRPFDDMDNAGNQ